MTFGITLGEYLLIDAFTSMFCIAIDHKNEPNMKVATSNINIKIHQLFSKHRILGICVIIAQRKTSGDLKRTVFRFPLGK